MKPLRVCIIEPVHNPTVNVGAIQTTLSKADFIVGKLNYDAETIQQLTHFGPELILLCLAANDLLQFIAQIHQQKTYLNVPLIVVSSAQEIVSQVNTLGLKVDGFISIPIQNEPFISMIKDRIIRARSLSAQMIRDSLSGLLNHAQILEQLKIEIARANRDHASLAFAMVDIDHFKMINDTHGHMAGDSVIENLAILFEQRLRKSDSIGRYGGDEFAVILPKSTALSVYPMLTQIKNSFSQLHHTINHTIFTATLSVGIADLSPNMGNLTNLVQAADDALYQAKNRGRNQIVIANNI